MQPGVPTWDEYFLEICRTVSRRSKDPNTKLGAVVVGPAHEIRATGYNSLVRGIRDDVPERLVRPEKYLWMEHAERNAIYNAARHGVQMQGCTLYVELLPCMDCARAIVQAGIKEVVVDGERVKRVLERAIHAPFRAHPDDVPRGGRRAARGAAGRGRGTAAIATPRDARLVADGGVGPRFQDPATSTRPN